ncbi:outer membrane protein assembly factor BamD [Rhodopseudomonas julia]|uniref:Outer membrane protein assembly factor BamD n=1 Tax=Rhodopseudomonas julia TaxID=200617 RepID=A0ABU0C818_9BRAD|nr:outer membrane protein assembly factor BamD [Rhodopseudomonas julia]MDQ0326667.1 outer membrane protein assembly factor BamD [Rhodopseudomonas julia]
MTFSEATKPGLRIVAASLLIASIGASLGACSNFGDRTKIIEEEPTVPADVLYNEGLAAMKEGETTKAKEKFAEIDKQHPYSDYARRSMILSAYLNYKRGNYTDAVTEAKRFVTLFPASDDAAYAQYIIAESYYRQIPDVTRDQEMTQRAILAYGQILSKYPDSEYADDARRKIEVGRDQLAGKEMQTGRYYQERGEYLAAVNRFKSVVEAYQTTRHVEEALHRLVECYLALGLVDQAQTAAAVLGHNFPDSPWYKDSYRLLAGRGVEPSESKGSWISRAFRSGQAT